MVGVGELVRHNPLKYPQWHLPECRVQPHDPGPEAVAPHRVDWVVTNSVLDLRLVWARDATQRANARASSAPFTPLPLPPHEPAGQVEADGFKLGVGYAGRSPRGWIRRSS